MQDLLKCRSLKTGFQTMRSRPVEAPPACDDEDDECPPDLVGCDPSVAYRGIWIDYENDRLKAKAR